VIKGLLLDCYGTVVEEDDEVVAAICARAAATAPGPVSPARVGEAWWRAFVAASLAAPFRRQREIAEASLAAALASTGCTADAAALCADQFGHWRTAPLRPGVRAFLDGVDLPICIVSDIDRDDLEALLGHHGLSFAAVVTSEDVGAYKPSPRMFRRGLAALGLRAEEVLHVGDSLTRDVAGARSAGIAPVWVNRRNQAPPADLPPAAVIGGLADLAGRLPRRR